MDRRYNEGRWHCCSQKLILDKDSTMVRHQVITSFLTWFCCVPLYLYSAHVRATPESALKSSHLYVEHGQLSFSPALWQPSLIFCLVPKYLECSIPYFTSQAMVEAQLKQSVSFILSSNVVGIQNCW